MSSLQTCSGAAYNWKFRLTLPKSIYGAMYIERFISGLRFLTRKNEKNPTPKPPRLDLGCCRLNAIILQLTSLTKAPLANPQGCI